MQNILAAVTHAMKSLLEDDPKPPLHIGEALTCWTYLAALEEIDAYELAALNTTQDAELIKELKNANEICKSQIAHLRNFLLSEGVPLPPTSEPKPKSDPASVPLGVKPTDDEIANGLSIKAAAAIISCATAMAQSVRTDIGIMWARFQAEQVTYAASLKALMQKRSWLKIPPYYEPPGRPKG